MAQPPIATEPPPVSFQKLTEPVALGDTFRSHVPEPDEAVVSPPGEAGEAAAEDRSPRSPRSPRVRGGMLDDDDESSDGEPEAPAISPRTAARREKARLAADREEAEYVATKALADAEARRLDREQNAEKYAAEDAARRVSEAEAKIGDADVVRLRKVYEEACDADGRLPVPNLLTAFAKLTGTKPQWEEGVALAGGPGAVVASADAFVLLASALDPSKYTPPAENDADAIFRRVMEQRKAARPPAPPSRSPSRSVCGARLSVDLGRRARTRRTRRARRSVAARVGRGVLLRVNFPSFPLSLHLRPNRSPSIVAVVVAGRAVEPKNGATPPSSRARRRTSRPSAGGERAGPPAGRPARSSRPAARAVSGARKEVRLVGEHERRVRLEQEPARQPVF